MRNLIFLATLCVCILGLPSVVSSDEPDKTLHNKCLYPTVLIEAVDGGNLGTGTVVRSEKVGDVYHNVAITCAHVLGNPNGYVVSVGVYKNWSNLERYETYHCRIYRIDENKDLAVVLFKSGEQLPTAEIDFNVMLYIGSDIFRIGCGAGDEMRLDFGKITSVKTNMSSLKDVYRMNIYTVPGDSGSAVFYKYKIVAITQAIRSSRVGGGNYPCFGISYAIPISRLKTWNDELNNMLAFVYETKEKMPVMWSFFLKFDLLEAKKILVPDTPWEKHETVY